MLYIKTAATTTLYFTFHDTLTESHDDVSAWRFLVTNDVTQATETISIAPVKSSVRYFTFDFIEPDHRDFKNIEGSYTYEVTADGVSVEKGKLIVYDGTLNAEGLFGDEVTYTEHDNTYTNTQYITI